VNVSIPRQQIREAAQGFSKIVNGKTALPVLGCVRVQADDSGFVAQATDLDQVIEYRFEGAEVYRKGACIIPLSTLKDLAKGAKHEQVEIYADASTEVVLVNHVGGHALRHPVAGMDLDEWPEMDLDVSTKPAEGFLATYRKLLPFSSTDETRYVLNGVYVDTSGKGETPVSMVATDGRRLAMFNSLALPIDKSVIVPTSKFLATAKLAGETEIGVRDEDGTTWLGLNSGPWRFAIKTVDGTYPNYGQVIPAVAGEHVVTFTDADVNMLKTVLPTVPGDETVTLVGNDDRVTIYGRADADDQWTTLTLDGASYNGTRSFVGINRHYLLDALNAGFREFNITDELCPLLSLDGQGGTHVLMPMRVEDPEGNGDVVEATAGETAPTEAASEEEVATPPVPEPPEKSTKKRRNKMPTETKNEVAALDRVSNACDTARMRIREAGQALTDLSKAIRDASREQKAQEREVEAAKAAIKKVQSLKLAA
jgi:DNA polymerase-3 subunit beta